MNGLVNQQRNDEGLRELALFAGAGGGILGGHLLGWRTVCAVEYNAYARSVLLARQNDGTLPPFPVLDDVRTFDGKPWRGLVDVVSGGFPCQDISAAGKGAGIDGERSGLWSHMARIIREVGCKRVEVENSPMLTSRGLGVVLGDLAEMGFDAEWGVISAADTGAVHKRDRIWIVAYAKGERRGETRQFRCHQQEKWTPSRSKTLAYTECIGLEQVEQPVLGRTESQGPASSLKHSGVSWWWDGWPTEPELGRVADGVADRVDRLKAIGNGQVPRVAAAAWRLLA